MKWWKDQLSLKYVTDLNGCLSKVEQCLQGRIQQDVSNKTVEQYAESLSSFCNWCVNRDYLEKNPMQKRTRLNIEPERIRRSLTVDEIKRLLTVAPPERKMLYIVTLCVGDRAGELSELTCRHFDPVKGGLQLDAQ